MSSSVDPPLPEEEIDLPNWSDTSEDDDDPNDYMILDPYADFLLSVETAMLTVGGNRYPRIYGDIHISGCQYGKAFTVYHRTADEAEMVPPSQEVNLTLCGPRYSVCGRAPELLYVDLHEHGTVTPFLQKIVPLHSQCRNLEANKPFQVSAEVGDHLLTVHMTAFSPSVVTRTELTIQGNLSYRLLFSGTVSAVQTSVGEDGVLKRTVPLFRRLHSYPEQPITDLDSVPLDRQVAVTPVHIDDYLTQMKYELTLSDLTQEGVEPLYKPTDPVHGVGSSMVIDVDLKVVAMATEDPDRVRVFYLKGAPKFELMGSDRVGKTYQEYIVGADHTPKRKRKGKTKWAVAQQHSRSRSGEIESFTTDEDFLKKIGVMVSVTSFLNYSCGDLNDEVFEDKLPLYNPDHDHDDVCGGSGGGGGSGDHGDAGGGSGSGGGDHDDACGDVVVVPWS